jgi:hypothetical protein
MRRRINLGGTESTEKSPRNAVLTTDYTDNTDGKRRELVVLLVTRKGLLVQELLNEELYR